MRGLTITESTPDGRFLAADLIDILRLLGSRGMNAEWEISGVECAGGAAADELHRRGEARDRVPGGTLLKLAAEVTQVIDGVFAGYRSGETHPWVVIRAVDSSAYDVKSDDEAVLARIRQRFPNAAELPGEEQPLAVKHRPGPRKVETQRSGRRTPTR
jgi:hypothetical protein